MQMSPLGGMRHAIIAELKALAPLLATAEDLHRTKLEQVDAEIGIKVIRLRPIEAIARKISAHQKLSEKYAIYIIRLMNELRFPPSTCYLEKIREFQSKYPYSILPEALKLDVGARSKERVEKLALILADSCLAHNRHLEKLRKKLQKMEGGDHPLHEPSIECRTCKAYHEAMRNCLRAEVNARDLWIETSELRAREKSTAEAIACLVIGGAGGAVAGLAVNAIGNSELTIGSMQAGAQAGPSVVTTAKGIVTGEPQIINQAINSRFQFKSLGLRVTYAFQPESSGIVGYWLWNTIKSHPSHTIGLINVRLEGENALLCFNAKAFFPIEPMVYWQLCQKLWQQVKESKLPPEECLDILQQLESGHLIPENGYAPIPGVIDERLSFCSERLKRYCESIKRPALEPKKEGPKRKTDYSLGPSILF